MDLAKIKARLAELITLFSRCRQRNNFIECSSSGGLCFLCRYSNEHSEYWGLLEVPIFLSGVDVIMPLLPDDVIRELYPALRHWVSASRGG